MFKFIDDPEDNESIDITSRALMRMTADYKRGLEFLRLEPHLRFLIVSFSEKLGKPIPEFLNSTPTLPGRRTYNRTKPYTKQWRENVRKSQAKRRRRERLAKKRG